ncbi:hypothetical protein OAM69_03205 [bacterium]|nr:hypothetical protein [bacterium]
MCGILKLVADERIARYLNEKGCGDDDSKTNSAEDNLFDELYLLWIIAE